MLKYLIVKLFRMNYLERNHLVIAEVGQSLRLQRGVIVGSAEDTTFRYVGHYRSPSLDRELFVGLKEHKGYKAGRDLRQWITYELAFIRAVEHNFPYLLQEFPVFYGLLADQKGKPVGRITEDFSEGGRFKVFDIPNDPTRLPTELRALIGDDYEELATMCFSVNGQRRLGNFDSIIRGVVEGKFPYSDLINELENILYK